MYLTKNKHKDQLDTDKNDKIKSKKISILNPVKRKESKSLEVKNQENIMELSSVYSAYNDTSFGQMLDFETPSSNHPNSTEFDDEPSKTIEYTSSSNSNNNSNNDNDNSNPNWGKIEKKGKKESKFSLTSSSFLKFTSIFAIDLIYSTVCQIFLSNFTYKLQNGLVKKDRNFLLSISFIKRTKEETLAWRSKLKYDRLNNIPSYKELSKEVHKELSKYLMDHFLQNSKPKIKKFIDRLVFFFSFLGIGHFLTHYGRKCWKRVIEKYFIFLLVCLVSYFPPYKTNDT
jgi:hypothetical protein